MLRFRVLQLEVRAVQIDSTGHVEVDGKPLIGDVGSWVVITSQGEQTVWSDDEFRKSFEPADAEAAAYLAHAVRC